MRNSIKGGPDFMQPTKPARRQRNPRLPYVFLGIVSCLLLGCGPGGPRLVPVSGTLSLDGQPLAYKSLLFIPEGETGGNGAGGYTDGTGNYELIAVVFGSTKDHRGCPPGRYRVVVSEPTIPIRAEDFEASDAGPEGDDPVAAVGPVGVRTGQMVPAIYSTEATTTLLVDVPDSGGQIDVALTSN